VRRFLENSTTSGGSQTPVQFSYAIERREKRANMFKEEHEFENFIEKEAILRDLKKPFKPNRSRSDQTLEKEIPISISKRRS